ncbi:MAG TPA: hypothetical protein VLB27_07405, partial [candidate division Zixibacteria bacterium]|nr:hypothetical protein [candidate division Zixibacteria bacterium]
MRKSLAKMSRVLTFQLRREDALSFEYADLATGLLITWIVGIGRYWDHPNAGILQYLGFGSVIYVFLLGGLLWLVARPLASKELTYFRSVAFVSLTSAPALLYSIPVERFMEMDAAATANAWFLVGVATLRVGYLAYFYRSVFRLTVVRAVVATLLPLTLIVVSLALLNLEKAVFSIMGGFREST